MPAAKQTEGNSTTQDPLYRDLHRRLRQLITSGEFAPGDRFLSERAVRARFQVSRPTANKALANLMAEGLVAYRRGVGTFVQPGVLDYDLRKLVSFTSRAGAAGRTPETRVLEFQDLSGSDAPEAAEALMVAEERPLVYMKRLRLADDQPVILERRWVPRDLCPDLTARDVEGSVYSLWTRRYGLAIAAANQTLTARSLSPDEAGLLNVEPGSAALLCRCVGRLAKGQGLWYEQTLYRGDAYEFHMRLGGQGSPPPVAGRFRDDNPA
jgi:GntR family transcriptional regulator